MVKRDLSHGDQAKTDRCLRGKTRWMLDLRKSIKTTSNFSDKQPRYGEVRDVAIHPMCDITSHSVSSESRVNNVTNCLYLHFFKSMLAILGPTHCMSLFGKDICI